LKASVPRIGKAEFDDLAAKTKAGCPVSKLINAKITLEALLVD
jgi:osmotically inducible protein OsmC